MPLQNIQYDTIMREYNRKQLQNRRELEERRKKAYAACPRLPEIDQEVAAKSAAKARALLKGGASDISDLKSEIALLSEEREVLLASAGFPADYLEMQYHCPLCQDTGYVYGKKCTCFRQAAIDLLYNQSNLREILQKENFSHFSLDYYSDTIRNKTTGLTARQTAAAAVRKAKDFIENFHSSFQNLFLYGDTGVGKTFLSHCIAYELLNKANHVVYFSAFDLFEMFEQNTFSKKVSADMIDDYIFKCDLLIIDDLGTELTNTFVASALFLCVNERLSHKKSTIISTNLSLECFSETYSERVFSRIASNYDMINLIGKDIRIQKLFLGGK